jgi:OPA family glycerol-3-phosphate transporter-like MFS transporter
LLANVLIGYVAQNAGWNWTFVLLIVSCAVAVVLMLMTHKAEMRKE